MKFTKNNTDRSLKLTISIALVSSLVLQSKYGNTLQMGQKRRKE
jgi:hypothetical protein